MRKLAICLVIVVGVQSGPQVLHGQTVPQCTASQMGPPPSAGPNSILCSGQDTSVGSNRTPGSSGNPVTYVSSSSSSAPSVRYIPYDRLASGPDGQPCITTGYFAEGTQPNDSTALDPVTQNVADIHGLAPLEYPPCPPQSQAAGQPGPVETPSMIARRYWEQVALPQPKPVIAPGRAITGKLAYLETRGQLAETYRNNTVFGQLTIQATGSYVVAWGDGETRGPYSFEGVPWPNGRITHAYSRIGAYNIVVTQSWTATWSLGGETGVLRTLQTTGRIDNFPVEQIQAVIGR